MQIFILEHEKKKQHYNKYYSMTLNKTINYCQKHENKKLIVQSNMFCLANSYLASLRMSVVLLRCPLLSEIMYKGAPEVFFHQ